MKNRWTVILTDGEDIVTICVTANNVDAAMKMAKADVEARIGGNFTPRLVFIGWHINKFVE